MNPPSRGDGAVEEVTTASRRVRGATPRAASPLLLVVIAAAPLLALGGAADGVGAQVMDDHVYTYVAFDQLEYIPGAADEPVEYDGEMWIGGDYDRLWIKARGEQSTLAREGIVEGQALYSRAVSAFWNAQAGLGVDHRYGPGDGDTRGLLTLGVQGLAPYWFEVEAFVFVSHAGDVSARVEASYDLFFTQRLILEPELELRAAVQEVPELGIGSGLGDLELGARLRYEVVRELAPYAGISWVRRFGDTADLARAAGSPVGDANFVAGLRWWY